MLVSNCQYLSIWLSRMFAIPVTSNNGERLQLELLRFTSSDRSGPPKTAHHYHTALPFARSHLLTADSVTQ